MIIEVPRDCDGSFAPQALRKRQRRMPDVDELVMSLSARSVTTGEISAHTPEVRGMQVSKETMSNVPGPRRDG